MLVERPKIVLVNIAGSLHKISILALAKIEHAQILYHNLIKKLAVNI